MLRKKSLKNWKRQHMNTNTHTNKGENVNIFQKNSLSNNHRFLNENFHKHMKLSFDHFSQYFRRTFNASRRLTFIKSVGEFQCDSFVYVSVDNKKHARLPRELFQLVEISRLPTHFGKAFFLEENSP